jgi:hypothetical protein
MGHEIAHVIGTMTKEAAMDKMSAEEEENIQGFPHGFYI